MLLLPSMVIFPGGEQGRAWSILVGDATLALFLLAMQDPRFEENRGRKQEATTFADCPILVASNFWHSRIELKVVSMAERQRHESWYSFFQDGMVFIERHGAQSKKSW
ncbi:hypothetical protein CJ030_MR0G001719 [Morella rubra]|uniref:Uncharacterized protein n=1 Tax=Morella rubra TaxID=262757 RepID=A0A6A1UMY8_9ROSI|nr:hypothetical protein CJ030_MR0G001719 [Morella rubra]